MIHHTSKPTCQTNPPSKAPFASQAISSSGEHALSGYRPDKFARIYHRENGGMLWSFLQEHDSLQRMEIATYLDRPAIEALSPTLLQRFGGQVAQNQVKRMIGHMVRQIMEARGYRLDRSGVPITRRGNIFFSGSRYIRSAPH